MGVIVDAFTEKRRQSITTQEGEHQAVVHGRTDEFKVNHTSDLAVNRSEVPVKLDPVTEFFENYIDQEPDSKKGQWLRLISTNRWLRTAAYGFVCINCCAIYFGWQQFQKVLFRGGAYAWLCTEDNPDFVYSEATGACEKQNAGVQVLYTIASAMEYIVGVVAGVALDHLGPRACGISGLFVLLFGVVLLMFSSQRFNAYTPSMILLGGSVNFIAFPSLLAGDFFPNHQALAITFIVSAQIGCAYVGIVLLEIWRAYERLTMVHLFTGYILIVWLTCVVLYFFLLPCRRRVEKHKAEASDVDNADAILPKLPLTDRSNTTIVSDEQVGVSSSSSSGGGSSDSPNQDNEHDAENSSASSAAASAANTNGGGNKNVSKRRHHHHQFQQKNNESDVERATPKEQQQQMMKAAEASVVLRGSWRSFLLELLTWDIQLFTVYYISQLIQFVYYPTIILAKFGTQISDFAGYIMPSQIVFGIFFGWTVDKIGTLPLCFMMNTLNLLTFSFCLIPNNKLQYFTVFINCISQSFIYSSKYTYVTEIYSPQNFGKLSGFIGFCGGIFTFVVIPIAASSQYILWSSISIGVSVFCYFVLIVLFIRMRKGINYLKSFSHVETTGDGGQAAVTAGLN